ncbi:glycoprotein-N-acetylgalactosamine 3-beta-galactosyltransferase 1 [Elysia marginata]|uniref:N-acetylgalactosaminide beta-1,3-galactosyltransferase n=1 Tax=Elysia marginata TaxID=1093978 RepID=A0AAV4F633_9GAST|nr:glycoprotein-N-acetylgalactosamine 3-beta-galactosyltransferase 1 [Elysia marginata]
MHGKEFDWFLKSDDDTYIVMENLREMLRSYDPDSPVYFGYRFKPYTPQGYMSGGAGYILSREALRRLVVNGILGKFCGPFTGVEDLDIGRCLYTVGVEAKDSLDNFGLERFHPLNFFAYFGNLKLPAWTGDYAFHPLKRGFECCSNKTISFHYIRAHEMYMLEFLIYHMRH